MSPCSFPRQGDTQAEIAAFLSSDPKDDLNVGQPGPSKIFERVVGSVNGHLRFKSNCCVGNSKGGDPSADGSTGNLTSKIGTTTLVDHAIGTIKLPRLPGETGAKK